MSLLQKICMFAKRKRIKTFSKQKNVSWKTNEAHKLPTDTFHGRPLMHINCQLIYFMEDH